MTLKERLRARILAEGPLTAADYMDACLHDPAAGYYAARPFERPILGEDGDFVTAPLVSQMFGELLGLWAVETWARLGTPPSLRFVEAGPGDGTLMADMLRAARLAPAFLAAAEVWMVETSRPLRERQAERVPEARFADTLDEVPGGAPVILIANELLDCLPARQFVLTERGWAERRVGLGAEGELAFGLAPAPADFRPRAGIAAEPGILVEVSPAQASLGARVGARIVRDGGAALLIDYGRDRPEPGDTLQALRHHQKIGPLETPGEADLTVHADFPAVAEAAQAAGAATALQSQRHLLGALGIEARAAALARLHPEKAQVIQRQLARLTDPEEMGVLFKALAITRPGLAAPGFEA